MGGLYGGSVIVVQTAPSSCICNVKSIPASSVETLLVPDNAQRKGVIIYNQSVFLLNIKFGSGVTSESFTVQLLPGSTYEMAQTVVFLGDIYGVWDGADGSAHITELI